MRDYDEEDPKKPQPVRARRKGENAHEAQESGPSPVIPKDEGRDFHRHVIRC